MSCKKLLECYRIQHFGEQLLRARIKDWYVYINHIIPIGARTDDATAGDGITDELLRPGRLEVVIFLADVIVWIFETDLFVAFMKHP